MEPGALINLDIYYMSRKSKSKIKAAGALFLAKNTRRYLFLLRDDDTHTNTWGLVGGRLEANETIIECLHREIMEEIGERSISKIIPLDLYTSQDERFEYHTFACIVEDEFVPQLNHEHKGYCWTTIDGLPKPVHPALYNSINVDEMKSKLTSLENLIDQLG